MYRKILFGHDGSKLASAAIPHVAAIAGAADAEVTLVHVVQPLGQTLTRLAPDAGWYGTPEAVVEMAEDVVAHERAAALNELEQTAAQLHAAGVTRVRSVVVEGSAAASIMAVARREESELIVMATRGHSGVRRMLVGSVAGEVLQHAHCPVLLVGKRAVDQACPPSGSQAGQRGA